MGGYLAQQFYAKHHERVSHLILLCTSGEEKKTTSAQIRRSLTHFNDDAYLAPMIDTNDPKKKQAILHRLNTMMEEVGPEALKRQMYATQHRYSVLDQFPSKPSPTLVVGATNDKLVPKRHIEKLVFALKAEFHWIESGHMLPLEAPDELGDLLKNWLDKQSLRPKDELLLTGSSTVSKLI
jgi:pimeloyl-ACP methyl ester carboxylesterase